MEPGRSNQPRESNEKKSREVWIRRDVRRGSDRRESVSDLPCDTAGKLGVISNECARKRRQNKGRTDADPETANATSIGPRECVT